MSNEMTLPLKELVQKSAIDNTSLPNSIMSRQQSDRFIDLVIDHSVLMKSVRVRRVNHPKGEINKLNLGSIVTEGAHTTSRATTRTPTEDVVPYDMAKYRSAFDLGGDFVEDNIEGSGIRDTLLSMFTKRISVDTEIAGIESDLTLAVGDAQSDENNLLGVNEGWQRILEANVPAAQQVDAAGAAPSKELYYAMKRAIPARFRVAMPDYRWITPSGPFDKNMLDWSHRETQGGDRALADGSHPGPWGINMLEVPLMPEDLSYGTAGTDGSQIWLTPLQNLIVFIQREFTLEVERKPRQDKFEFTIHFRLDFAIEDPAMVVIADNVSLSGNDYTA